MNDGGVGQAYVAVFAVDANVHFHHLLRRKDPAHQRHLLNTFRRQYPTELGGVGCFPIYKGYGIDWSR